MKPGRFFYGVGRLELHIPHSRSLKDKRSAMSSLKHRLAERGRIAVIDAGPQEFWQRGSLGIALLALEEGQVRSMLATLLRTVEADDRVVVLSFQTQVGCLDDEPGGFT